MFEKFRNNTLKDYGLCPSHYLKAPGLSWDAILKMTKIELELIPDPDMYIFLEKSTRGRIFYISNRYSKANDKYSKTYDTKQESKHIYLDANNLYGFAMSKFFPTSGFKQIDPKEFDLNKYTSNSSRGYTLEVDHEYQKELRELNNDYPLAPDKIETKRKMSSEYQLKITNLYNIPINNVKKLVPNFFNQEKYVLHYENLQLYLRRGLKLKKKHRLLEFNQSQWLKPYTEFSTQKRIEAEKNKVKDGKSVVQSNEPCYILKNNGKLKKQIRCKTSKQRKSLFEMFNKTKLYVAKNI